MKITVWIRPDRDDPKGRGITLRADWKPESGDTPPLQHYGLKLFNSIEGTAAPASSHKEQEIQEGASPASPALCGQNPQLPAPKGTP